MGEMFKGVVVFECVGVVYVRANWECETSWGFCIGLLRCVSLPCFAAPSPAIIASIAITGADSSYSLHEEYTISRTRRRERHCSLSCMQYYQMNHENDAKTEKLREREKIQTPTFLGNSAANHSNSALRCHSKELHLCKRT